MFEITSFLEQYGAKPYNDSNYTMDCIFCGKGQGHFQISIDSSRKVAHCFKCHYKTSWIGLVAKLKRISYESAKEIVEFFVSVKVKEKRKEEIKPVFFPVASCWTDEAWNYLEKRGLTEEDIQKREIYFCNYGERYKNRIIFPITLDGKRRAFQARAVGKEEPRYLSGGRIGDLLYGYDELYNETEVALTEGIFDQIMVAKSGYSVVASFGKKITEVQRKLLKSIGIKKVLLAWDADAYGEIIVAFRELSGQFDVEIIPVLEGDPAECADIHELMSNGVDNIDDFMKLRMDRFYLTKKSSHDMISI